MWEETKKKKTVYQTKESLVNNYKMSQSQNEKKGFVKKKKQEICVQEFKKILVTINEKLVYQNKRKKISQWHRKACVLVFKINHSQ